MDEEVWHQQMLCKIIIQAQDIDRLNDLLQRDPILGTLDLPESLSHIAALVLKLKSQDIGVVPAKMMLVLTDHHQRYLVGITEL